MLFKKKTVKDIIIYLLYLTPVLIYTSTFYSQVMIRQKELVLGIYSEIITHQAASPFQYRILTPYIIKFLNNFLNLDISYIITVFIFTYLSIILFHRILRFYFNDTKSILINLFFIISLLFSIFGGHHFDSFNLFVFMLGYILLYHKKIWLLGLLIFVGTFNRSTTLFLILFYLSLNIRIDHKNIKFYKIHHLKKLLFLSSCWLVPFLSLRIIYPATRIANIESTGHYLQLIENMSLLPLIMLFTFLGIIWFLAYNNLPNKDFFIKRILYVVPLFLILHFLIGRVNETRLFLPIAPPILISGFQELFVLLEKKDSFSQDTK